MQWRKVLVVQWRKISEDGKLFREEIQLFLVLLHSLEGDGDFLNDART